MAGAPVPPPLAHSVANLPRPPQANKETVQLPRMMQPTVALAALAGAAALLAAPARAAGTVNTYSIDDPEYGSCRLKGVDESSDNFKYYASVSGEDETLNSACARCIKVTEGDASVTAYVLDVCDGCASGEVQLSSDALSELGLNSSTVGSASVSWDFVTCPSNMLSGNVKACLMEGASYSYIPLEFYNSYKVISAVTIDGVNATSTTDSYLWYANSGNASTTWYKSIDVEMTSTDGETKSTTFAFTSTSGCATSDVQFSVASTADGVDGSTGGGTSSSSSSSAGLIGGIVGAVVVVLLIIASVIVYKRRRRSSNDTDTPNDVEGQYLSPKKRAATGTAANEGDQSHHDHDGSVVEPRSPTMEYAESYTPAAGAGLHQPTDLDLDVDSHPVETESAAAVAAAATGATLSHGSSTSSMASVQGARPSSHLSFGTNSPASPAASHASSAVESEHLSSRSGPRALSAEPTFRFSSKNMYSNAAVPNPQKVAQSQKAAPTLTAPVIPASMTANLQYDDDDDRGSFDVDDMRGTEEMKTNEPLEPSYDERSSRAYGAPAAYYAPESAVTSPQSYVRATSLRRNPSQRTANPTRSSSRFNNNSTMFSDASQPSTYAAPAQQQQPASSYAYSSQPHSEAASSGYDPYGSQPGSFRESTGGYSRESLNILGYPYSKRSQRHMNN